MAFPTPREAISYAIRTWEGEWQQQPQDSGNYAHCQDGSTKLIGTMRGVTPDALARHLGVDPCKITVERLKKVTADEAADIAMKGYYHTALFDTLTWSPLVDVAFDASFLSGPGRGIKMLQECVGAGIDGGIGPQTREAIDLFLESTPIEDACNRLADIRNAFYISISQPGTKNAIYRQGWLNRSNSMRPGDNKWWQRWKGWVMPHPAGSSKATGFVSA
jgi:lysozyme family protein